MGSATVIDVAKEGALDTWRGSPAQVPTLGQAIEEWLTIISARNKATAEIYLDSLNRATPLIMRAGGMRQLTAFGAAKVYIELQKHYSPSTAVHTVHALSSLWKHLIGSGAIGDNPWLGVRMRTPKDTLGERLLSEDEVAGLLHAPYRRQKQVFLRFLYYTGARVSEAIGLRQRDIAHTPQGTIVTLYGKGDKTRFVHIPEHLYDDLASLGVKSTPDTRFFPWGRTTAWKIVKSATRDARIDKGVSPHWLRHAHATHSLDNGAPIHVVQDTLGHSSLETTRHYLHVRPGVSSSDNLKEL